MSRTASHPPVNDVTRLRLELRGQVQGVGFRPAVHRLASSLGLTGWVCNDARGVILEVQGRVLQVAAFEQQLFSDLPPLAQISDVARNTAPLQDQERGFAIADSVAGGPGHTQVPPDVAVCDVCIQELFDPRNRRFHYPFINCTDCGPRYTLTRAMPYARAQTTMAPFALCLACQREYDTPSERRFHAQPIACSVCGPQLALYDAQGVRLPTADALAETWQRLQAGDIVAIKGLGGFHLVCDARNAAAVERLRQRKRRASKPFAVMALNLTSVAAFARASAHEARLLEHSGRPIVLLEKAVEHPVLDGVAPHLNHVGVMLPYTPLHYLLYYHAAGMPAGQAWLARRHALWLVMTSANPRGEPLVKETHEAFARLAGIADGFLVHDRDIAVRCDDSVVRVMEDMPVLLRRARGYTPRAVTLPASGPSVVAFGAFFKNTVCLTRGNQAFASQYIGDLDSRAACEAQQSQVEHFMRLLDVKPVMVACDLHPDFPSTRLAAHLAAKHGLPLLQVQHHHAHAAAVAAEHGLTSPLLALTLDGVGLGPGGQGWGGELLRLEAGQFQRLGHLLPLALPGGDRAAREPWRVAAGVLHRVGRTHEIALRWPQGAALCEPLAHDINITYTSSAGRLFDAAAALLGVCAVTSYEAEAAMRLEALAARYGQVTPAPELVRRTRREDIDVMDFLPLLDKLADETHAARGAALFHATLADALARWVVERARETGIMQVVLAGGCFLNRILTTNLKRGGEAQGLRVYQARELSPGDEGVSLGQAWVALQRWAAGGTDGLRV